MAKGGRKTKKGKKSHKTPALNPSESVDQYVHDYEQRPYNPPVGLVTPETDKEMPKTHYEYDPHLDPQLQWAGKKEHTSFEVDTVSLHVHERIDPLTVIEKARKKSEYVQQTLFHYFEQPENNPAFRHAVEFYKHSQNWSNRMIAGDSLLIMNSLVRKESMAGKVQMIYMDPPYGIKYGSNFQPFVQKRDVKDGKDQDLTQEPEMIKAFRDTWELHIHSYLTYLRDRLLLSRELLNDRGSIFVQISDENLHIVRNILDEVFGRENFVALIPFRKKTMPLGTNFIEQMGDFILWYAKQKTKSGGQPNTKYHRLFLKQDVEGDFHYCWYEMPDGSRHRMTTKELNNHALLPADARVYRLKSLEPSGKMDSGMFDYEFEGRVYPHPKNGYATTPEGMDSLKAARRLQPEGNRLTFIMYADENVWATLTSPWIDTIGADDKMYVVQTNTEVVKRCMLMTTDPGDLILDPTCGSGTTAFVAEKFGRRWITCDTSRVAIAIAKQRLMTAVYDYYELAQPQEGVASGFEYQKFKKISLGSIANNEPASEIILYDQPKIEKTKVRVSGPFTVEAVPAPTVRQLDDSQSVSSIDESIARSGETSRQDQWRSEILATGILGRGAEKITFSRVERLEGTEWLHADAETKEREPRRVVMSFGADFAPLEQRQVERAVEEAQTLVPKPKIVLFAAFQFDPEAAKDIDEIKWPGVSVLRVQMNTDLLTEDLKRKVSKSQSFWLMGQPDVELKRVKDGNYVVEVKGFDYYNTQTHEVESGDSSRIAMWMLDTDYDGRSLYPQQVFFPLAGDSDGWSKIGRSIKADINEDLLQKYHGTVSIPFESGSNKRIAIKIIDDRGIESLKIIKVK